MIRAACYLTGKHEKRFLGPCQISSILPFCRGGGYFTVYFERKKAQTAKSLKTRINKGKTRISAGFSLAEMERFELSNRF